MIRNHRCWILTCSLIVFGLWGKTESWLEPAQRYLAAADNTTYPRMLVYWHVNNCCYFIFEFINGSWKQQVKLVYVFIHILFKMMAFFWEMDFTHCICRMKSFLYSVELRWFHIQANATPVWVHVKRFTVRTGGSFFFLFFLVKINVSATFK